ncbi:MAG: hypothetical protein QF638_02030 [Acidimicrobiales bacterium]|jgi:hypothetical protein|nr:hypothetical protein [Acidimicrobiales bacterium]
MTKNEVTEEQLQGMGANPAASAIPSEASRWYAQNVQPAPWPQSVRDPDSRTHNNTKTWYFSPPTVDIDGIATTGLPVDVFHTAPCWQAHQRASQENQGKIQVLQVDRYGQLLRGSPYVALLSVDSEVWDRILAAWEPVIELEIEIEKTRLEQAELDLDRAREAYERNNARRSIRVLSERIAQLEMLDCNSYRKFFDRESEISITVGRSPQQVLSDDMSAEVAKQLDAAMTAGFEEHRD